MKCEGVYTFAFQIVFFLGFVCIRRRVQSVGLYSGGGSLAAKAVMQNTTGIKPKERQEMLSCREIGNC